MIPKFFHNFIVPLYVSYGIDSFRKDKVGVLVGI